MPDYKYRAMLRDGKIVRGKMLANNKHQVVTKLKEARMQPIIVKKLRYIKISGSNFIKAKQKSYVPPVSFKRPKLDLNNITLKSLKESNIHLFTRVSPKDIISFVNNLYVLKKAEFNNVQALQAIYDGMENPVLKDIVEDVLIGVEAGERLNVVMANYPKIFPAMFVNFIKVGEESGNLDVALLHARDYVESSTKLRKQIRSAIVPRVLQFVGIMLMMFVSLLVGVPMLKGVYAMFGSSKQLPAATLVAVSIAEWIVKYWYIVLGIIIILIVLFLLYIFTPNGRYKWDRFLMRAPVMGGLNTNITVSKFFQAMLLNLKNGMRIQEALDVSKNVTSNYYFLSVVEVAKSNSLIGTSWITPFEESKLFKPMVSQMISIGMKTDLTAMMEKVNDYIKMEIEESISKFVKVLPDVTYAFVGVAIIAFVLTVMVPLMDVYMGSFITAP